MTDASSLWLLLAVPAFSALLICVLRGGGPGMARVSALTAMLAVLAVATRIFLAFDATELSRFDFHLPWMPSLGIDLHLRVDGFNVYLLLLTALVFPVVLVGAWSAEYSRRPLYLALLLILEASLLGAFLSQNLVLFFVFWEAVLIPMGILILVFGGKQRRPATMAFFLYTLAGSVLLLAAVIVLGAEALHHTGRWSFDLTVLQHLPLPYDTQLFVFIAVMIACLVKCPLVPFHSWLPLAYCEAPPSATALMAGALSKLGAFGMLKLALPLAPQAAASAAPYMVWLAVFSILYGAVLALREQDYKRLIAYSSLSHMGYIVLGIFSLQHASLHGAMLQMLSHGVAVTGLFMLLGAVELRGAAAGRQVGALASTAPRLAVVLMLFVLTSLALPLTSGFTAEFLVLFGAFTRGIAVWRTDGSLWVLTAAILASTAMVLGAAYMLRFARSIVFDRHGEPPAISDLSWREIGALAAPLLLIAWIGVAPASLMAKAQGAVGQLAAIATSTEPRAVMPVIARTESEHGY